MTIPFDHAAQSNWLLASLSRDMLSALTSYIEQVSLFRGDILEISGKAIEHVYFPGQAVISVGVLTSAGTRLEAGLVGPEGMTGLALLNGVDRSPNETFVQMPGRAWRITSSAFRKALEANRPLHDHLLKFAQVFSVQIGQTALSNGHFTVEQRAARWILMCHDRLDREDLIATHEVFSAVLGVRRASVTVALNKLVSLGAIKTSRGALHICDRARLLSIADEAYGVPEAEYERIML